MPRRCSRLASAKLKETPHSSLHLFFFRVWPQTPIHCCIDPASSVCFRMYRYLRGPRRLCSMHEPYLISNSAKVIQDGVMLGAGVDEEVEQQRRIELAPGGQAVDLQNPFQRLILEHHGLFQERGHRDGPRFLLIQHAVLLDLKADPVLSRHEEPVSHPRCNATLWHEYLLSVFLHQYLLLW